MLLEKRVGLPTICMIRSQTGCPIVVQTVCMTVITPEKSVCIAFMTVSNVMPESVRFVWIVPNHSLRVVRAVVISGSILVETHSTAWENSGIAMPATVVMVLVSRGMIVPPSEVSRGVSWVSTSASSCLPVVMNGSMAPPTLAIAAFRLSCATFASMTAPFTSRYLSAAVE